MLLFVHILYQLIIMFVYQLLCIYIYLYNYMFVYMLNLLERCILSMPSKTKYEACRTSGGASRTDQSATATAEALGLGRSMMVI